MSSLVYRRRSLGRILSFQRQRYATRSLRIPTGHQLCQSASIYHHGRRSTIQVSSCFRFFSSHEIDPVVSSIQEDNVDGADKDDDAIPNGSNLSDSHSGSEDRASAGESHGGKFLTSYAFAVGNSPLNALNNYYTQQHKVLSISNCFELERNHNGDYTATFVCPVTGNSYPAGTLRDWKVELESDTEGRLYYRGRKSAMHAAAARALDAMQYEELGVTEPRLCEEDPSIQEGDAAVVDSASDRPKTYDPLYAEESEEDESGDEEEMDDIVRMTELISQPTAKETTDVQQMEEEEEEEDKVEEEEFVVTHIERVCGQPPSQRILESLSKTSDKDSDYVNPRMPISMEPFGRLQLAVDIAESWARANDVPRKKSLHRVLLPRSESPQAVLAGKMILSNLAEANQSTFHLYRRDFEVQRAAKRVLDVLWQSKNSKPDADDYASYLKCLDYSELDEGDQLIHIAKSAEEIVRAMKNGEVFDGHVLPKPNINTMNALIQLWAQVGGTTGRYADTDADFKPNRESFLAVLSSSAYPASIAGESGGFDPEFARTCIKTMTEMAEQNPDDESLLPDTQVYNAALPWSGGMLWRKSRPYARPTRWDPSYMFGAAFKDGFQPYEEDNILVKEARAIEAWMEKMESSEDTRIAPNIETYEAVIQAWLRTGTKEGIERAEEIAIALLSSKTCDDSVRPRLLTFRPIISSWRYSKDPDGPTRMQQLVERLESASEAIPELRPDGRIYESHIHSYVESQSVLMNGLVLSEDVKSGSIPEDRILDAAKNCNRLLETLCRCLPPTLENGQEPDLFVEVISFQQTVFAWLNVAAVSLATADQATLTAAISEMVRAVNEFEKVVEATLRQESVDGIGLQDDRELSRQLKHFVTCAPVVYAGFAWAMRKLLAQQKKQKNANVAIPTDYLLHMERMIRRSGELEAALAHDCSLVSNRKSKQCPGLWPHGSNVRIKERIAYEDLYIVSSSVVQSWNKKEDFFRQSVLGCLRESDLENVNAGDFVRLCLLIRETAESSRIIITAVDKLMDRVMPVAHHSELHRRSEEQSKTSDSSGEQHQSQIRTKTLGSRVRSPRRTKSLSRRRPKLKASRRTSLVTAET